MSSACILLATSAESFCSALNATFRRRISSAYSRRAATDGSTTTRSSSEAGPEEHCSTSFRITRESMAVPACTIWLKRRWSCTQHKQPMFLDNCHPSLKLGHHRNHRPPFPVKEEAHRRRNGKALDASTSELNYVYDLDTICPLHPIGSGQVHFIGQINISVRQNQYFVSI